MIVRMLSLGILGALGFSVLQALVQVPAPAPAPGITVALTAPPTPLTIVDVARSATAPAQLAHAMRLGTDEQVIAVNDVAVRDSLAAGAVIGDASRAPGSYLDLTVRGAAGERRLLVLVH